MRRPRRVASAASATALLLAAIAALAVVAAPGRAVASEPVAPGGFTLQGSNGYSIFVFGIAAHKGKPAKIGILVTGKTGGAIYSAPANITDTSIEASLGALGAIDVTFHPSGRPRTARSTCSDRSASFDAGHYQGTIQFRGEHGYTEIDADRAPGDLGFFLDVLCVGATGASAPNLPGAQLEVARKRAGLGAHLKVVKNRPRGPAHFEAGLSERRAGISIARFTSGFAPPRAFDYDRERRTAILRPPAPFSGAAHFHRYAKPSNRWTGNLTVDLPGRSDVALTGNGFRPTLVPAHWSWSGGG